MTSAILLGITALLQGVRGEPTREEILKKVDRAQVERAIAKGVAHLSSGLPSKSFKHVDLAWRYEDLILLTLLHAGVSRNDPALQKALKTVIDAPLDRTYYASIQAMAFLKLDKAAYQWRIAQCAQFLVDNQDKDGGWAYGREVPLGHLQVPTRTPKAGTTTLARIVIQRRVELDDTSDSSNAQYAAMGFRAAHDASISVPFETLKRSADYWDRRTKDDGSSSYREFWPKQGYGAMTAGAMASLSSLDYLMGTAPRLDARLQKPRQWLARNWSVSVEPLPEGKPPTHHTLYYYLYSLERAGTLFGTELFGSHEWYVEGARFILDQQREDGGWGEKPSDTCFAILFLRRATDDFRPPVATVETKR